MDRRTFLSVLGLLSAPLAAEAQPAGKGYRIGVKHGHGDHAIHQHGSTLRAMARVNWRAGTLTLLLLATAATAHAQTPGARTPLLGILSRGVPSPEGLHETAFRQALRERGWIEGQNLRVEIRYAEWKDERLESLAAELIRLNPDVLWTYTRASVQSVARLTTTVPIVTGASGALVELGFARSLAQPGGNVTGIESMSLDLEPKRVEVLRDALPGFRRIGVLGYVDRTTSLMMRSVEKAAATLRLEVVYARAVAPPEIESAIAALARDRAQAVLVEDGPLFAQERARVATISLRHRLPTISQVPGFAEAGGLLQYGADMLDQFRRSASHVDRILRGAKPGDIPIEQATKIELIVNLKTAKALGVKIPQSLLIRADRVIQ